MATYGYTRVSSQIDTRKKFQTVIDKSCGKVMVKGKWKIQYGFSVVYYRYEHKCFEHLQENRNRI